MRNIILITILSLLSPVAIAQVQVTGFNVVRNGDQAKVLFNAKVDPQIVRGNYMLTLTPRIVNGEQSRKLAPIVIMGRRRRIMDTRNRVRPMPGSYIVTNEQTVTYRSVMPYADWMEGANFSFEVLSQGCGKQQVIDSCLISHNIVVRSTEQSAKPNLLNVRVGGMVLIVERNAALPETVVAAAAKSSSQTMLEKLVVDFRAASSNLEYNAYNNNMALERLITSLRYSEGLLSGKIDITGYASPEGVEHLNYELAERRALAVRNYILDNVHYLRLSDFNIINGGENWEGLRKIVEESTMPGRWQVIDIIDTTPPRIDYVKKTSRKKQLMNLEGGRVWKYMLANFFPELRSAASVAIYRSENNENIIQTEQAKWADGRAGEIINRAVSLIGKRKTAEALKLLVEVESDPRSWNPLGVCYVLEQNNERAKIYFNRAVKAGYKDAESNLEQIK